MSDKPETFDDILAEMRASSLSTVRAWADRIDAAATRERNEADERIRNAWTEGYCMDPDKSAPGNAAAMRESVETMRRYAMIPQEELSLSLLQRTIHEKCDEALAAPARNCDRFKTAVEARRAFESAHSHGIVRNLYTASFDWLFDKAEGGAK